MADISEEDLAFLKLLKKEVKETPKTEETKNLKEWMLKYLAASGELPAKQETPPEKEPPKTKEYIPIPKMREPPRISTFSGSNNKGEATYELWRYEVCGLMADKLYDPENINYAVRRSLKGEARTIAMHLGPKASIPEILHKLDSIYENVERKEDLLAQFYRARQEDNETVTKWSCRLEDIIGRAVERGIIQKKDTNSMLHSMLSTGLKTELKEISGHKFDSITDFDEFRIALRQIETDHEERKSSSKPQPAKAATSAPEETNTQMDEFKGMLQQLTARFDKWERGKDQHRGYRRNPGNYRSRQQRQTWSNRPPQPPASATPSTDKKIVCYRCGQEGHKKIGCANPPNYFKKDLNSKKPMEEGRH